MQEKEFDKMLDGSPANMADLSNNEELKSVLDSKDIGIVEKREAIAVNEQPISDELRKEIYAFIESKRGSDMKPRTLKRLVARKFNINVV